MPRLITAALLGALSLSACAQAPQPPAKQEAAAAEGLLAVPRLRRALLVLTGALGSVSALALPLSEVHHAIDLFGPAPSGGRTAEPLRGGC